MRRLNTAFDDFPDYTIKSCTNTGVWLIEQTDRETGLITATYDFVNREYSGPETGGAALPIETLGGSQERSFFSLQKQLNKALLK